MTVIELLAQHIDIAESASPVPNVEEVTYYGVTILKKIFFVFHMSRCHRICTVQASVLVMDIGFS